MIVCICRRVTDHQIRTAIEDGASTVAEVGMACRAGTGCGACQETIAEMLVRQDCGRTHLRVLSPYLQGREAA